MSVYVYSKKRNVYCRDTDEYCNGENYLMSKHWKQMRVKVYQHFKRECQRCNSVIPLEQAVIHHRTYKRFGNEHLNDLVLYCNSCHAIIHKNKKQNNIKNKNLQRYIKLLTEEEKIKVIKYIENYILCFKWRDK